MNFEEIRFRDLDTRVITISMLALIPAFLYLFKYWFIIFVGLFFVSVMGIFRTPKSYVKLRSFIFGYFASYLISAVIGFSMLTIE
jgi:hypothetical protein